MRLYHATPQSNIASIQANGLDPNRATGKEPHIWLHTVSRRSWAILHTSKRHKCDISQVVIIEVEIPRSKIRRRRRGIWTTAEPISEFQSITNTTETEQCQAPPRRP